MAFFGQDRMIRFRQILAVGGEIEPGFSFAVFTICVRQLTYKMRFISPLRPCLSNICTNRPRGTPNLIRKRILLFRGKSLTRLENLHRKRVRLLIYD